MLCPRLLMLLVVVLFLLALPRAVDADNFTVSLLHTNDINGDVVPTGADYGFPALAGGIKGQPPFSSQVLLDSGNYMGYSLFFRYYNATTVASLMSKLGYKYLGIGASELFFGPNTFFDFLEGGNFTALCANCRVTGPLATRIKPYTVMSIIDDKGTPRRLGVVGYAQENLCAVATCTSTSSGPTFSELSVSQPIPAVQEALINMLHSEGSVPPIVIALSSELYATDVLLAQQISFIETIPFSLTAVLGCTRSGETRPARVTTILSYWGDPIVLMANSVSLATFGVASFTLGTSITTGLYVPLFPANATVVRPLLACTNTTRPPACVVPDANMTATIAALNAPVVAASLIPFGTLTYTIIGGRPPCRVGECTLGNLMTMAVRAWIAANRPNQACTIAFLNGGSMRSSLAAGNVTTKDIFTALPFTDTVAALQLQGSVLVSVLQRSLSAINGTSTGLFLQMDGIRILFNAALPVGLRLISATVRGVDGQYDEIKASQFYSVCTNSWLATGGDGYTAIPEQAIGTSIFTTTVSEATRAYVAANSPIALLADGRIASTTATVSNVTATPCEYDITIASTAGSVTDLCGGSARVRSAFTWRLRPSLAQTVRAISLSFAPLNLFTFDSLTIVDANTKAAPASTTGVLSSTDYMRGSTLTSIELVLLASSLDITFTSRSTDPTRILSLSFTTSPLCPSSFEFAEIGALRNFSTVVDSCGRNITSLARATCSACIPGMVNDNWSNICVDCLPGQYASTSGMSMCRSCQPGTAALSFRTVTCSTCDAGTYSDSYGRSACASCVRGTFQPLPGSSECRNCSEGFYQNSTGRSSCLPCAPGTHQPTSGSPLCRACDRGTFADLSAQSNCSICEAPNLLAVPPFLGTYSNASGLSACLSPTTRFVGRSDFSTCSALEDQCACLPGLLPPDCKQVPYWIDYSYSTAIAFIAASCAIVLVAFIFGFLMVRNSEHAVVKGTSFFFSLSILVGICLGLLSVFILFTKPSNLSCCAYTIVVAMSYCLILGCFIVKTWRLWRIFSSPITAFRNKNALSNHRLFLAVIIILTVEVVSLIALSVATPMGTSYDLSNGDEYGSRLLTCGVGTTVRVVAMVWTLLYLIIAGVLVYLTRRVRTDQFGESGWIVVFLLITGVLVPLVAVGMGMNGFNRLIVDATAILLSCLISLIIIFLPKIYAMYANETFSGGAFHFLGHRPDPKMIETGQVPYTKTVSVPHEDAGPTVYMPNHEEKLARRLSVPQRDLEILQESALDDTLEPLPRRQVLQLARQSNFDMGVASGTDGNGLDVPPPPVSDPDIADFQHEYNDVIQRIGRLQRTHSYAAEVIDSAVRLALGDISTDLFLDMLRRHMPQLAHPAPAPDPAPSPTLARAASVPSEPQGPARPQSKPYRAIASSTLRSNGYVPFRMGDEIENVEILPNGVCVGTVRATGERGLLPKQLVVCVADEPSGKPGRGKTVRQKSGSTHRDSTDTLAGRGSTAGAASNELGDNWIMVGQSEAVASGLRRHSSLRAAVPEESVMSAGPAVRRQSVLPPVLGVRFDTSELRQILQATQSTDDITTNSAPAAANPLTASLASLANSRSPTESYHEPDLDGPTPV
eukprot:m.151757 g.151757  ORF g.151757 m.151757 type:complete len:1600 (-) comp15098_c0_seq5:30-4829(-)